MRMQSSVLYGAMSGFSSESQKGKLALIFDRARENRSSERHHTILFECQVHIKHGEDMDPVTTHYDKRAALATLLSL